MCLILMLYYLINDLMKLKTSEGDRLEDLSKDKLVALLRSTYEYKGLTEYFEDHDLVFLDKLEGDARASKKGQAEQKTYS